MSASTEHASLPEEGSPPAAALKESRQVPGDEAQLEEAKAEEGPAAVPHVQRSQEPDKQPADGNQEDTDAPEEGEASPPLPPGPPPASDDDGWNPVWDDAYGAYYFFNSITGETTWTNPRVPDATGAVIAAPGATENGEESEGVPSDPLRYNPAIHGDYDPTAPYAQIPELPKDGDYTTTAAFNRFTGKFQSAKSHHNPENYNDENKSRRQMEFYFDVDAAANSHEGKSLKAERQTKKLTKKELKQFKEKRKARKEEKRKAWLKD